MLLEEIPQIQQLSKAEKLELVAQLWDSMASMPDDLPVSDLEKRLLNERFAAHRADPDAALTLDEFKQRLAGRL